jgi:hypothetical protein
MKLKSFSIIALATLGVSTVGCKKWLDVNTNPNEAGNPSIQLVLPSAEVGIATVMGNVFQINGSFWAQHWTQSPLANQYKSYDQYQVSSDNYNLPWRTLYSGALADLKYVYNKASAEKRTQYQAIARLMQAYTFQVLTDAFGDIPFNDALKGSAADGNLASPKYDKQADVYTGIIALVQEAQTLIDPNDAGHPGADDVIYGGNMSKWAEFANTLLLKAYMRLSEVDPAKAQAGIASITGKYLSSSAKVAFTSTGGNENPLYSEMVGLRNTTNIFASKTCVDYMNNYADPRVYFFYTPLANGNVVGLTQGDFALSTNATGKSIGGYGVAANPNDKRSALAPVYFISLAESEFLQAEAIARGWMTGEDKMHYENGVYAGMNDYLTLIYTEITEEHFDTTGYGSVDGYIQDLLVNWIPYPTDPAKKVQAIIEQKWAAMSGNQGFEAWTEWRRTGYPDFFTPSVASLAGPGVWPVRMLYPTDEITLNANFPGTKKISDKMWWDAN